MRAVTGRPRSRGQALTELAIAAPLLVLLLVGGAQVGAIVYGQVTIDTAAREGARVGSEQPLGSGVYSGTTTVHCASAPSNPVCKAVLASSGLISSSSLTVTVDQEPFGTSGSSTCNGTEPADGYVMVTVVYDVPVFVPLIDRFFSDAGTPGSRALTAVVRDRVEPCTITNGQ